jgi:glycosyltransferase involved in cell wall biosynthesis
MSTLHAPTSPIPTDPARELSARPRLRSLSVVLPCFNEEPNVAEAIRSATAAAAMNSEAYEIIVVDDGSSDGTARVAGDLARSDPHLRLILHMQNRGYGAAMRSGIEAARMEWVLLADADLQFDLRELSDFVPLTRSADVLWGRRILRQDTLGRRMSAAAWNRLVSGLFRLPVHDVDCGLKLVRRDVLERVVLQTTGAMISTELAVGCRAVGARFDEIGVHHRPRIAGEETGGKLHVILRAFRELATMYPALRSLSRTRLPTPIGADGG